MAGLNRGFGGGLSRYVQTFEQLAAGFGDLGYGAVEGGFIDTRRFAKAADLANELQGRRAQLVVGGAAFRLTQNLYASAHL